jgi:hypothetical protein
MNEPPLPRVNSTNPSCSLVRIHRFPFSRMA